MKQMNFDFRGMISEVSLPVLAKYLTEKTGYSLKSAIYNFILFLTLLCLPGLSGQLKAQAKGICFIPGDDWHKAVKQAIKEKKLLFVDCYTQTCAPCQTMAVTVFTEDSVGQFFNRHFVCVKCDMGNDAIGKTLGNRFEVEAYPTLLFVDPKTQRLEHKMVGFCSARMLIGGGQTALDPQHNLAGMQKRYANGERETGFVADYIRLLTSSMSPGLGEVVPEYLGRLSAEELATPENWTLLLRYINDPLANPLRLVAKYRELFYNVAGQEAVDYKLAYVLHQAVGEIIAADPVDSLRNAALIEYLEELDDPMAPGALASLYAANAVRDKKWIELAGQMKTALHYNLFRKGEETAYFEANLNLLAQNAGPETIRELLPLLDELCNRAGTFTAKADYMQLKAAMQKRNGDAPGAAESEKREQQYRREAENNLEF